MIHCKDDPVFMARYSAFSPYRQMQRESGLSMPLGAGDALARSLYCGMKPIASWSGEQANTLPTGGVFNLEFSPDGSMLVAACEKKSIQIFDSLTHKTIHTVTGAHSDCVNCVKFLDGRMFATCSDDTTIALWDVRNLKRKICSLLGHSNWVKNIEFSMRDKLLVTSGLDGSIYTWDINSYSECNLVYQRVFHASGLMRCRLSPDARQMVMCTTRGLLVIVHNLNLNTLAQDLHGFKPNLFRLMQTSKQLIPIAAQYDHLFDKSRKENRIEFISDFPDGNDAEVVSALQIHPLGWSALSRNISHDDRSEWSCIHDIQPVECSSDKSVRDPLPVAPPVGLRRMQRRPNIRKPVRLRPYRPPRPQASVTLAGETLPSPSARIVRMWGRDRERERLSAAESGSGSAAGRGSAAGPGARAPAPPPPGPPGPHDAPSTSASEPRLGGGLSSIQNDVWEASITIKQHRMLQEFVSRGQGHRNFNMQRIMGINTGIAPPPAPPRAPSLRTAPDAPRGESILPSTSGQTPSDSMTAQPQTKHFIRQNRDRLLYYIEETNEGKGFIKELCYSADGRLVCSPFGCGMRLLALNQNCSELSNCVEGFSGPKPMVDVGQSLGIHQDLVVSCKFSPRHHLLVTGCLEGKIVWYEPFSGEALY